MSEYGIFSDPEDVKLTIMFALKSLGHPAIFDHLNEIVISSGRVNYFDEQSEIEALLNSKHISKESIGDTEYFVLTELGHETIDILEMRLPYSVRERIIKDTVKLEAKIKYNAQTRAQIKDSENGFIVTLGIIDGSEPLFEVSLLVSNRQQAETICKTFKEDPEGMYADLVTVMTRNIK
ncbi:MAG: DUF4364 family protein [Bacillota bacterium]|nr:DUF4364 family protein [Bacillota bacterium]